MDKEETKGTPLPMPETPDWGNAVQIVEPGVKDEQGNAVRSEDTPDTAQPDADTDAAADQDDGADDGSDDNNQDLEPASQLLADPGEFTPADYSFDVVSYDEEGKNPKITKIKTVEQWDEFIGAEPNLGNAGALLKAQRLATKMETGSDSDKKDWQKAKDAYDSQQEAVTQQQETIKTISNEIGYLVEKGHLPRVANQYVNADWTDPEVAKQAGVKEQLELLDYMRSENKRRVKAGLKPTTSVIDAYNAMQLDQTRSQQTEATKKRAEARKEAGNKVAGSTPSAMTAAPKGIAVGRTGRLSDLDALSWNR